jgi:hypothetical protein
MAYSLREQRGRQGRQATMRGTADDAALLLRAMALHVIVAPYEARVSVVLCKSRRDAMSLHPQAVPPVPEETACIARTAFRTGNLCLQMRDELGALYTDESFAPLFPARGQPAEAPWHLALVTVLQYAEGLSEEQAALAVRGRIDWQ